MSFGQNLQFLRKMHKKMTQEELAEKMNVSRQTISKWEMEKAIALCNLFSCSLDEMVLGNIDLDNEAYTNIRVEKVSSFQYVKYEVISPQPEDDAKKHIYDWAINSGIKQPEIIGWDFPFASQEQINVYHMHGYVAALIIPKHSEIECSKKITQSDQLYAIITIKDPFKSPFTIIPNAYKTLMRYMEVNGLHHKENKEILSCFEKEYNKNGSDYMEVYIAIE
ncbi:helix-turn-helix transcriptional regulator [Clostridium butyricum]|uniref:helix-turn-helix transcriptional regulator n=1 Tax=Clostridium butyricum TaxID=1492 RepID=UPI001BA67938|nr:helix-turn-helix transcriptional regulator [Clostridium butyricum]QUF84837.1 helix-turn-helix transcriptional regulator [Clostridium butyricum]